MNCTVQYGSKRISPACLSVQVKIQVLTMGIMDPLCTVLHYGTWGLITLMTLCTIMTVNNVDTLLLYYTMILTLVLSTNMRRLRRWTDHSTSNRLPLQNVIFWNIEGSTIFIPYIGMLISRLWRLSCDESSLIIYVCNVMMFILNYKSEFISMAWSYRECVLALLSSSGWFDDQ